MAWLARRWSGWSGGVPFARLLAQQNRLANARGRALVSGVPGMRIKRLFDEKKFRGYGPYGYDVKKSSQESRRSVRGSGAYLPERVVEHVADANLRWRTFPIYGLPRH
jgi:hypothetical protein